MESEVIGEAFDDVLAALEVSGMDAETIGAVLGSPQLATAVKKAQMVRRGAPVARTIRGGVDQGVAIDTFLPMVGGGGAIAAGATTTLTGTPLRNFNVEDVEITGDESVTVQTVTLGGVQLLAATTGNMPAQAFSPLNPNRKRLDWGTIPPTQSLVIALTNTHASATRAIFGALWGNYTTRI